VIKQRYTSLLAGAAFLVMMATLTARSYHYTGLFEPLNYFAFPTDSTENKKEDVAKPIDLKFPVKDREGDHITGNDASNPFLLNDPKSVKKDVEYDPESNMYIITEKMDGRDVKPPVYMTFEEYREYERKQALQDYWQERANSISLVENKNAVPNLVVENEGFDKLFGGTKVEIKPSGNIDLTLGGNYQKIDNPILAQRQRRQGGFDFNMNININVVGNIGDKLKLNFNYNTQATFDFENQIKLNYQGKEDDIIKNIEAGNVTFPLTTSLIRGSQSLFGVKTQLQFGRLRISTVLSQQRSKSENLQIQNGTQIQRFEIFADQYDENRHFFLSHFFREQYNRALSTMPNITSLTNITRIEVWVTNRTGVFQNVREVVGFSDMAETNRIYRPDLVIANPNKPRPENASNSLYGQINNDPVVRSSSAEVKLAQLGYRQVEDFEKAFCRKLNPNEYTLNSQLGYISLNQQLFPDEILCVAYEYTFNGEVLKVGEFAQDVSPDLNSDGSIDTLQKKPLLLKMLKSTANKPAIPLWDLMMKNVYSLGAFQVSQEEFRLDIYYQDPGGGLKRFIPEGEPKGKLLIRLLNLDNLNIQRDPQPDGVFDFYPGVTIIPNTGRLVFPVLEPFGEDLRKQFAPSETQLADKYSYDVLYDSTKFIAQQFPEKNRYLVKGSYRSSSSSDISLGAFNIPQGSVIVTAGGNQLKENTDYTIDYSLGRIKILNEGILNSGVPINVSFENNALFGFQQKTFIGNRLDYRVSDKFNLGATILHLKERPFTQKVNIGDDPISNTIYGFDFNYNTQSRFLTWLVDKLPLYRTKEISSFTAAGEIAYLKPGYNKAIGRDGGQVYVDDFEGTSNSFDLKFPANSWIMASTPRGALDRRGNVLFPEAELVDDLRYGMNRAKLAWYNIDPLFLRNNNQTPDYIADDKDQQSSHYVREVFQNEIFPNRTNLQPGVVNNIITLDLAFYPNERGPYNFENNLNGEPGFTSGLNLDGTLKSPRSRWGGIMRAIDNNDFENSNVEFIEFWVLDPFIENDDNSGELYINLGNISEDILRDSKYFFENGLTAPGSGIPLEETAWGKVPTQQNIVNAFDNDPAVRQIQDVGLDGLSDIEEIEKFNTVLANLQAILNPDALVKVQADPSGDNFKYYLNDDYDNQRASILGRYKNFNGQQGNSPVSSGTGIAQAQTNTPDSEDLNRDFTTNKNEQYFQYRIPLSKQELEVGKNNIVDKKDATVKLANGNTETVSWYQFKIPVREYERAIGGISDFRSIRFMRMYLTGFEDSVILRFARVDLVRNQWRRYFFTLQEPGEYVPQDFQNNTFFNVIAVNVEENANRTPIPYVIPEGIQREQNLSAQNINALQNEQSLSLQVCNLLDGDARAVNKTLNLDMRYYDRIKMFIHAESRPGEQPVKDGDVRAFLRLGPDFTQNYYEYEIPLSITQPGVSDPTAIWPEINELNLRLDSLIILKLLRDDSGLPISSPFSIVDGRGNKLTIVGNPDLGYVENAMLGIRNPKATGREEDDGLPKCVEVWFNELRLNGIDDQGGMAALGRMEAQLADLGNLVFSTNYHQQGFGQVDQRVAQRFRDNFFQYDAAGNIELGKFLPQKSGIRLPMYASISQSFSTPQFDPYKFDVPVKLMLDRLEGDERRDYRKSVQDITTIKSLNFTNVRKIRTNTERQPRFYDIENLNFTYAYSVTDKSTPIIEFDRLKRHKATVGYNHAPKIKYFTPFAKIIKSKNKYFDIIKDANINFLPSGINFTSDWNRLFGEQKLRNLDPTDEFQVEPTYFKSFTWDRFYGFQYNPFKSLTIDFTAANNARIDEPPGKLDTEEKKDSLWNNILRFGRNTRYTHTVNANYNVPINKLPILDWVQVRAGYSAAYTWTAAPLFTDSLQRIIPNPLGNTLNNSQDQRLNGEFNLKNLYNKIGFLKQYNNTTRATGKTKADREKTVENNKKRIEKIEKDIEKQKDELKKADDEIAKLKALEPRPDNYKEELKKLKQKKKTVKERIKKLKDDKKKITNPENPIIAPLVKPIISIKRISVNYTDNYTTQIPGWVPSTTLLGADKNYNFQAPGWDFLFGYQPDRSWLDRAAEKGYITPDTNLNFQLVQTNSKNLNIKATIEPFNDLRADLTINKTVSEQYTEYFKKRSPLGEFEHLNPMNAGTWSISYISVRTLFQKSDQQGVTEAFKNFNEYRTIISERLSAQNPFSNLQQFEAPSRDTLNPNPIPVAGYYKGYGPYSQEVLMPAFLAAYRGKDPKTTKLNPFTYFPLPNWRITYTGLNKFKFLQKVFTNVTISHAYNSTFSINSYLTQLSYKGDGILKPSEIDTATGNFYSQYVIPSIVVSEQFSPLIGVDMTFKNNILARVDYKKTRNLSLGFLDYQLSESRTTEFTVGLGYRIKGLVLPIKIKGKKKKLDNDLNFRVDFSFRDNVTVNQKLDQPISQPTQGMKTYRISPSIDYIISNRLNIRLFFDRNRSIPATSASFPITNTSAGVTLRFTLVP
jgi:cell surface protein SprA